MTDRLLLDFSLGQTNLSHESLQTDSALFECLYPIRTNVAATLVPAFLLGKLLCRHYGYYHFGITDFPFLPRAPTPFPWDTICAQAVGAEAVPLGAKELSAPLAGAWSVPHFLLWAPQWPDTRTEYGHFFIIWLLTQIQTSEWRISSRVIARRHGDIQQYLDSRDFSSLI